MKKLAIAVAVSVPVLLFSGCTVRDTAYTPGYTSDYVYSVGYYGYRPYGGWRNAYWGGYPTAYSTRYYNRGWYGGRNWYGRGGFGHRW